MLHSKHLKFNANADFITDSCVVVEMLEKNLYPMLIILICTAVGASHTPAQRHSQNKANARAQHGHTMFARTSVHNAEVTRGSWRHAPPDNFGA